METGFVMNPLVQAYIDAETKNITAQQRVTYYAVKLAEAVDASEDYSKMLGKYRAAVTRHKATTAALDDATSDLADAA